MSIEEKEHAYKLSRYPGYRLANDIARAAGYDSPDIDTGPDFVEFTYPGCNVQVGIYEIDYKGNATIKIWSDAPGTNGELMAGLAFQQIKLLSQPAVDGLIRKLATEANSIEAETWRRMVQYCVWEAMRFIQSARQLQQMGNKPETMNLDWRLFPILQDGEPTTIFCPGGIGKSYLATYVACLVQFDYVGFTDAPDSKVWAPKQGNVLYCDWESTHRDHERRTWAVKRGLGIDNEDAFFYLPCDQPLSVLVPAIQDIIHKNGIALVIADSQMAGADFGPDMAQNATRYYNALRQLGTSALVLDHVPKAAMGASPDTNSTGPHGSVVKANRARQAYELTKHQLPGQGFTDLTMKHCKNNEGPLSPDFGIKITWVTDKDTGHLDKTVFSTFNVEDHPVLSTAQPTWKRIWDILEGGAITTKELAELLPDKTEANVRAVLSQYKDKFVKLDGDRWGRRAI